MNRLQTQLTSVEKLVPNPQNPRKDLKKGTPMYEKLKNSINEFEYIDPIIWNKRTGYIVSGHQRLQVMKDIAEEKGEVLDKVDVVVVDMTPARQDAFMIAVNKIDGYWDNDKLADIMEGLDEEMRILTGYDQSEIDNLLHGNDVNIDDLFLEDDNSEPKEKAPKTCTCPYCHKEFEI